MIAVVRIFSIIGIAVTGFLTSREFKNMSKQEKINKKG